MNRKGLSFDVIGRETPTLKGKGGAKTRSRGLWGNTPRFHGKKLILDVNTMYGLFSSIYLLDIYFM